MKRNVIFVLAAFVFAVLVAGCGGASTGNAEADKALDAMKLDEKAPTLGPVYRDFTVKFFQDDYDGCWDLISKDSQKDFGTMVQPMIDAIKKMDKTQLDAAIKTTKDKLPNIKDEKEKMQAEFQIKLYEAAKEDFKDLPDPKSYFVLFMKLTPKSIVIDELKKDTVVEEKIAEDGKTGYITTKADDKEEKKKFVNEDGQWKMVFGD